ncbi:MAG: hypothetical protein AMXMBFR82_38690 [Candidatus Hydrogenedentota bacterium]
MRYTGLHNPRNRLVAVWLAVALSGVVFFVPEAALAQNPTGTGAYSVRFEGAVDESLREVLRRESDTVSNQDRPPASISHLERRANRDLERFQQILKAEGYYAATVQLGVVESETPPAVVFTIDPGPRYTFGSISIESTRDVVFVWPKPESLQVTGGEPAVSRTIVDAEGPILARARNNGYPFPRIADRKIIVDHGNRTLDVTYIVEPGPSAVFGTTQIEGLDAVKEETVRRAIEWREGQPYDARVVNETQERLYDQNLFSLVRITTADGVTDEGLIPMHIKVAESKHRTITLGAGFDTDAGPNARASWEHRNIRQLGHQLTLKGDLSRDRQEFSARYLVPGWKREDQNLRWELKLGQESVEAYDSTRFETGVTVERKLGPRWTAGAGVAFKYSMQEQRRLDETYHLLSFPVYGVMDDRDDSMNPTEGKRLDLRAEPFIEVTDPALSFLRGTVEWRGYHALDEEGYWVIAARVKLGAMLGTDVDNIPPDERFYAGGGGSIRGFAYKTVSPLKGGDPTGGASLVEVSVELRRRITEQIGVAVFVDGGNAYSSAFPDFAEELRWGVGAGIRYFTPLGPLRVDVAVPVNARSELDDSFGVYVSFGQAF